MNQSALKRLIVTLLAGVVLLPAAAQAQSAIAGVVRDTSGGVLPGVTVEVSSPALIERVRTVTTDAGGLYRVIDLRPGTYAVLFTLAGFSTVSREGIVLETNFTANVSVELPVGDIAETLTVSGLAPIVDVQTAQQRVVLTRDFLDAIPSSRTWATNTIPAITQPVDVAGSGSMNNQGQKVYGSSETYNEVLVDGLSVMSGSGAPGTYYNFGAFEEVLTQVGGGTAEASTGGVIVNMIPRQGGNQFSGDATAIYANSHFTTSNYTDELRDRGLITPGGISKLSDYNLSVGGPIKRDKLWFFSSGRVWQTDSFVSNAFNRDGSPAEDTYLLYNITNRLTYQIDRRNKLSFLYDPSRKNQGTRSFGAGFSPEATYKYWTPFPPTGTTVLKYNLMAGNKVFIESGYAVHALKTVGVYQPEVERPSATNPYGSVAKTDLLRNTTWNASPEGEPYLRWQMYHVTSSISYVTGSHSFKVGEQFGSGYGGGGTTNRNGDIMQRYRNGRPDSVIAYNSPNAVRTDLDFQLALYAQDSWTMKRLTLSPGLRFDIHRNSIPEQTSPAGRFVPERHFAAIPNVIDWKAVSPRVGAGYDLFGDGRTALKANFGKYPVFEQTQTAARYNPMGGGATTDQRTWTDTNGDDIAQDSEIGPLTNNLFGRGGFRSVDPDLEWPYSWMGSISVQHELRAGLGLSVAYNRRSFRRLIWTSSRAVTFADYALVTIPDPRDSSQTLPVYNLNVDKRGLVDDIDMNSDDDKRLYDGVDFSLSSRFGQGGTVTVASSTGRLRTKSCTVADPNALRFCDQTQFDVPYITSFKVSGVWPLPGAIVLSGVFQHAPGGNIGEPFFATNYIVNRSIVPNLTNPSVTVVLDEPGSQRYPYVKQLDVAIGKRFRIARMQVTPKLEVGNALNASTVLVQVTTFGSSYGTPQRIMPGRTARLNLMVKF